MRCHYLARLCFSPAGTEFVRPVVGYFCNLCQVIYADEDEAKMQHCRSPTHYRKYRVSVQEVEGSSSCQQVLTTRFALQEKMGKDPWTS